MVSDEINDKNNDKSNDKNTTATELPCPAPLVMGMIGGKWKLLILQILIFQGTKRFGELRQHIDGITQAMLTKQLRALEADDLIVRKVYPEVPPRVEYSMTDEGLALTPVFEAMHAWWEQRVKDRNKSIAA